MDLQTEGVQTRSKAVRTILEWIEEVVLAIVLIAVLSQ